MVIRTPFVIAACAGFLVGVGVVSVAYAYSVTPSWASVLAGGVALLAVVQMFGGGHRAVACVACVAVVIGGVRFLGAVPASVQLPDGAARYEGRIVRVTAFERARTRVLLDVPGFERPLAVFMDGSAAFRYGDVIAVRCRARRPDRPRDVLAYAGTCTASDIQLLAHGAGSPTLRALDGFRTALLAANDAHLTGAAHAFVATAMLGDRSAATAFTEAFRRTGTIHALVISGGHMTIIGMLLRWMFTLLPLPRRTGILATMGVLAAFTAMVGAEPSAVRGALMVGALLVVDLFGRVTSSARILLLVAAAMVLVHPAILAFDLAFQLSFASVAGILALTPLIARRLPASHPWMEEIAGNVAASTAATIATTPLIVGVFGTLSVIGIAVNVPVLLLLPSFLIAAIVFLPIAAFVPAFAPVAAWPVVALADAIAWLVGRAADIPWASLAGATFHWWFILALYALLAAWTFRMHRRLGTSLLSPFATLPAPAAVLVGGVPSRP